MTEYTGIIESKDGFQIPVKNNISFHSKYNVLKESESFANQFNQNDLFFIIGGLCGGYHIQKLLEVNKNRIIIVIENSEEDIKFLTKIEQIKNLFDSKNVIITHPKALLKTILDNYLPAIYGKIQISFLRSWENTFSQNAQLCKTIINKAIESISADFSVQSQFGLIWHKNIFNNLKYAEKLNISNIEPLFDTNKTAAIIAAGPSLDESAQIIQQNREKYFVICTDTAYSTFNKLNIFVDVVVSIDGQCISKDHFFEIKNKNTLFLFDLCGNASAVKKVIKNRNPIIFFESGHPLSVVASIYNGNKNFIHIETGKGTVTIAATDFAKKIGFKDIEFFGADFSYLNGKPYAKGTYLDNLYAIKSSRITNTETAFTKLLYRTELINIEKNKYTTKILESYKESLDLYLKQKITEINLKSINKYNNKDFINFLKNNLNSLQEKDFLKKENLILFTLLPLIAFYEKTYDRIKSFKLALSNTLRYTDII